MFMLGYGSAQYINIAADSRSSLPGAGTVSDRDLSVNLQKYSIVSLSVRQTDAGPIIISEPVATAAAFTTHTFTFTTGGRNVTGLINIPDGGQSKAPYPVIVQFRGYVERSVYQTGIGTSRSGEVFAANGFITVAPDFLGYGGSDMPSGDVFEERFQTYTTALDLISAIPSIPEADKSRIGLWGHSNGGQIALTVLAVTRSGLPTSLWAPVTKPFPYSILYYTDEAEDKGKLMRSKLARFEERNNVFEFTFTNYLDRIRGPVLIHQGTADDAVPAAWNRSFADVLDEAGADVTYYQYDGADHNLSGAWDTVVQRDIDFYNRDR